MGNYCNYSLLLLFANLANTDPHSYFYLNFNYQHMQCTLYDCYIHKRYCVNYCNNNIIYTLNDIVVKVIMHACTSNYLKFGCYNYFSNS